VTVTFTVSPVDAVVDVDGTRADPSRPGQYTIGGALGSKHRVRVVAGKRETTADVVISSDGAVPDRIAVAVATPPSQVRPTPSTTSTARPSATPKSSGSGELKPAGFE
jgi:hypothetical protein